jgi:hypothetical protein
MVIKPKSIFTSMRFLQWKVALLPSESSTTVTSFDIISFVILYSSCPTIIDKGKLTFVYKIHSEQNPFFLPAEGGKFELPFTCKKQVYLNECFIEEGYSSLKGLRFKKVNTGNVNYIDVKKDGDAVGFYKFTFEGEGPYNQKAKPECYFNRNITKM